MLQFQKKSIPTPRKVHWKFLGEGVSETKILETKYGAKLEFLGEVGAKNTPSPRESRYFIGIRVKYHVKKKNNISNR